MLSQLRTGVTRTRHAVLVVADIVAKVFLRRTKPSMRTNLSSRKPQKLERVKLSRRKFFHLAAGAAALPAMSRIASAQAYPSRAGANYPRICPWPGD